MKAKVVMCICLAVFSGLGVVLAMNGSKEVSATESPIYNVRFQQMVYQFENMENIAKPTEHMEKITPDGWVWSLNPGSVCLLSGCAGSVCLLSGCVGSVCFGSGCSSTCGASGCSGSNCVGSGCFGSVCLGSGCTGSECLNCKE